MASPKECWYNGRLLTPRQAKSNITAKRGDFRCPECSESLRVAIGKTRLAVSGKTMVDHFEHWERNANCSLSNPPRGKRQTTAAKQRADVVHTATEGRPGDVHFKVHSRNRNLVKAALVNADYKCAACNFRLAFENKFVIECHHKLQVKHGVRNSTVDALQALCPTCHSIAHLQEPPMELEQIRQVLARATWT